MTVVEAVGVATPPKLLLRHFELLGTAQADVARLRKLILALAVQGKVVAQDASDEPASALLERIGATKDQLVAEGNIKRDKPLATITEDERPHDLPAGWAWARIGELGQVVGGGTPKSDVSEYWADSGVAWLTPADLYNRREMRISRGRRDISGEGLASSSAQLLPAGTVLFSSRAPIGYVAIASTSLATNQGFKSCVPHIAGLSEYLYWHLKHLAPAIDAGASGTTFKEISGKDFANVVIALPPLAEQSRIVARVDELMRLCDALEAKGKLEAAQHAQLLDVLFRTLTNSNSPEELAENWPRVATHFDLLLDRPGAVDALEQTILQLAVRGMLVAQDSSDEPAAALLVRMRGEKDSLIATGQIKRQAELPLVADDEKPFSLPQGWEWVRMGAAVNDSEAGWSPSCSNSPRAVGHWGVLKVSAVSWGEFDASANKELPSALTPRPELEVHAGDFLLSRANTLELVARSVVVKDTAPQLMLSDKIIRLHVNTLVDRTFLNIANNSIYARAYYAARASGTSSSMKNVSREVVLGLPVPLPPLAEQARIVRRVFELRSKCAELRQRLLLRQEIQSQLAGELVERAVSTA